MKILSRWIKSFGLVLFMVIAFSAATNAMAQDVTYSGQMSLSWTIHTYSCPSGVFCPGEQLLENSVSGSDAGPISSDYESCAVSSIGSGPSIPVDFDGLDIVLVVLNNAGMIACPYDFDPGPGSFWYQGDIDTSDGNLPVVAPSEEFLPPIGEWNVLAWDSTNTYPTLLTFNAIDGSGGYCDGPSGEFFPPDCAGFGYAEYSWSFNGELAACSVTYTGTFDGNLTKSSGLTCIIDGTVTGNVTQNGGGLSIVNSTIEGNVQVSGGSSFWIGNTNVDGNLQIQNIPSSSAQSQICGTDVKGNLQTTDNGTAVTIGTASASCTGNNIGGNLQITGGSSFSIGDTEVGGNLLVQNIPATSAQSEICGTAVSGNLQVTSNGTATAIGTAAASCLGNTIGGNLQATNNNAPVQVFDDSVEGHLQCQNNSSITGDYNTARSYQGQCAGF